MILGTFCCVLVLWPWAECCPNEPPHDQSWQQNTDEREQGKGEFQLKKGDGDADSYHAGDSECEAVGLATGELLHANAFELGQGSGFARFRAHTQPALVVTRVTPINAAQISCLPSLACTDTYQA
jgi:hypothetical protein